MIQSHPSFRWPQDQEQKIWRYLSLAKFIALLQNNVFWLTRADRLGDPFEGSITRPMHEDLLRAPTEVASSWRQTNTSMRLTHYVSCWHANASESDAMWRIYTNSADSVCIQSRFSLLRDALPEFMYAGLVNYIDFETARFDPGNIFNHIIHKRISFEHERELRFTAWSSIAPELGGTRIQECLSGDGVAIPLSAHIYVERLVLHPEAPNWFLEVVKSLLTTYGLNVPIERSSMIREAFF